MAEVGRAADDVGWRIGVEIELLAPAGLSRLDLAKAVADRVGGRVERIFHPQAEPSRVPGSPVFETLTLGFRVRDAGGATLALFVDDLTLQDDLDRTAPPKPDWYRIAGDDVRLMRLLARHCDPAADLGAVLEPARRLFAGQLARRETMIRLSDEGGAPVAIAAPLPGERERACEIVTRPLMGGQTTEIAMLLNAADALGFTAPAEGAIHVHFDAGPLSGARQLRRLVRVFHGTRDALREICRPNPRCRRLGPWSADLVDAVDAAGFDELSWPDACRRMGQTGLTKFCDFNILNVVNGDPYKHTFEVRILPAGLDAGTIIAHARLFAGLLQRICGEEPLDRLLEEGSVPAL